MKNISFKLAVIVLALFFIVPALCFIILGVATPSQYSNTFLGGLDIKLDRLERIRREADSPKLLLVGGSNIPFGVNSETVASHLKMEVVDFGLYAALGTKVMIDLSRAEINDGDIIVLCPETDPQTMSMYFGAESVWQAIETHLSALFRIQSDNYGAMAGAYPGFLSAKLRAYFDGGLHPDGVYSRSSFNEYGDVIYPREYNIMALGYDPNTLINLSPALVTDEFMEYINEYTTFAKRRGATVFYALPPMNSDAVISDENDIKAFFSALTSALDCLVISNPYDYILDSGYFYDSNFHLNDTGVQIRTMQLVEDIYRACSITNRIDIPSVSVPLVPDSETEAVVSIDSATDNTYFVVEPFREGLCVVSITAEAETLTEITVPSVINGKPVLAVGSGAFSACKYVDTIRLGANIVQLYDGAFRGCSSLERVYLGAVNASDIAVGNSLLDGVPNAKIYVSVNAYVSFVSDYFWSQYASLIAIAQ